MRNPLERCSTLHVALPSLDSNALRMLARYCNEQSGKAREKVAGGKNPACSISRCGYEVVSIIKPYVEHFNHILNHIWYS